MFSPFHHHCSSPSCYMDWDCLRSDLPLCAETQTLLRKDFALRIVLCSLSSGFVFFLTLLSFQSAYEYAVIFFSSYPFESRRTSGILQYYLC